MLKATIAAALITLTSLAAGCGGHRGASCDKNDAASAAPTTPPAPATN